MERFSATELRRLAGRVLVATGATEANAAPAAEALVGAECDGIASHGLSRLPFYADQIASGKVDGRAIPEAARLAPSLVHVDARQERSARVPQRDASLERRELPRGAGVGPDEM